MRLYPSKLKRVYTYRNKRLFFFGKPLYHTDLKIYLNKISYEIKQKKSSFSVPKYLSPKFPIPGMI
ncbi:hypothetical protein BpHYR1_041054 [Brachionus plicatilis]|uniref:Uncharacterized protein n=1 Tax=Brachionus plicatilis TaxID=10195 RepID=A0A3M7QND9_BRAPC|nr:hypothetical protein BpHYR1_041054 [Brachionus plicatilis]